MKLFLITDSTDALIGMRLSGIEGKKVSASADAEKAIEEVLNEENIGILLVTPGIVELCPETVKTLKQGNKPLLVTIPDGNENSGGQDSITEYIREAIGIKI